MGILKSQQRGIPSKEFYFLNLEKLTMLLSPRGEKTSPLEVKKLHLKDLKNFTSIPIYKDIKYKEYKEKNLLQESLPKEWLTDSSFQEIVNSYIQHRKEKGKPITPKAGSLLARKLAKYSKQVAKAALLSSIENGWTGVFPESVKGQSKKVTIGSGLTGQLDDINFE
jgi:hypothetical protein